MLDANEAIQGIIYILHTASVNLSSGKAKKSSMEYSQGMTMYK